MAPQVVNRQGLPAKRRRAPLHAQAMVQKLQRGALGPGVDAVVADGYHRQAVLPGQTEGNPVGKNGPSRGKENDLRPGFLHPPGESRGKPGGQGPQSVPERPEPGSGRCAPAGTEGPGRRGQDRHPRRTPGGSQAGAGPKGPEDVPVCDAEIAAAQGKLWLLGAE